MIKLNKITTKTGDKGYSTYKGKKLKKNSLIFDILGEIDKLNSTIGFSRSLTGTKFKTINKDFYIIQNKLFDIGAEILSNNNLSNNNSNLSNYDIDWLEKKQIIYNKHLKELTSFILPAGSQLSSSIHLCRTECRNLERKLVSFKSNGFQLNQNIYIYFNRLSDLFFTISRFINKINKTKEELWITEIDY